MGVTLSEVKRAARVHRAPLAGESAGYLVLALADQVLSAPRVIGADDVQLTDEGGLRLLRGTASSESEAELALRRTLDELLLVASSGSAALMRAGRRVAPLGLAMLVRELEAALIPVNRAAARRALARLHRETTRALALGALSVEEPAAQLPTVSTSERAGSEPAAPALVPAHPALANADEPERASELERASEPSVEPEPAYAEPECASEPAYAEPECASELDEEATAAIVLPVSLPEESALAFCDVDCERSVLGASEDDAFSVDSSANDEELTMALAVRPVAAADAEVILHEEDVEFLDEDEGDALTTVHGLEVSPIAASLPEQLEVDMPAEQCTRPEPIIVRQALRASARPAPAPAVDEALGATPTFGSLAVALPVLAPELIAELTRQAQSEPQAPSMADTADAAPTIALSETQLATASEPEEAAQGGDSSAPSEEYTEPMPEVSPLLPGVAIVASRKSDVSELLSGFQVSADDTHRDLRRAIKELAELDLTPAPFSAFNR
jgi:hypothetical protein